MPASQRSADPGVIAELLEQPHSFEFFQAVRLLAQARLPQPRYRNRLSLAFAPNQIENIGAESDGRIRLGVRVGLGEHMCGQQQADRHAQDTL